MAKRSKMASEWPYHKAMRDRAREKMGECRKATLEQLLTDMLDAMDGVEAMFRKEFLALRAEEAKTELPS